MSAPLSVRPDGVGALAAQLAALAARLADDATRCSGSGPAAALPGEVGWTAAAAVDAWDALARTLAARLTAVSTTLTAAMGAYHDAEAQRAARLSGGRGAGPVPR